MFHSAASVSRSCCFLVNTMFCLDILTFGIILVRHGVDVCQVSWALFHTYVGCFYTAYTLVVHWLYTSCTLVLQVHWGSTLQRWTPPQKPTFLSGRGAQYFLNIIKGLAEVLGNGHWNELDVNVSLMIHQMFLTNCVNDQRIQRYECELA